MYKEERRQKSFYDAVYEAGVPEGHFLRRLEELIDWRGLKKYLHKHYFKKGRPAHNPVMMFKLLVLQFLYDLSDRELEENARDRLSFRWFIGLDPLENPPDFSCYTRFRVRLIEDDRVVEIFHWIVGQARGVGLVKDKLSVVDATEVRARVDTYKLNRNGGEGNGPDPDAGYGHKSDRKPFFGYKAHIAMDGGSEIITKCEASPGDEADVTFFENVHEEKAEAIVGDKGYDSEEVFEAIREMGQYPVIIPRRKKGREKGHIIGRYYPEELGRYYRLKGWRGLIEHKLNELKNWNGLKVARYWGLLKVRLQVFLTVIAVNLKRMVRLVFGEARWELV